MRLEEFLTSHHVPFSRMHHRPAYTANRVAQVLHVPGKAVAKTVLLKTGHGYVIAVLPATHRVDLDRVGKELGEDQVGLATEREIEQLFPECERGALPPFGSLCHVPTVVDETLAEDREIVFEGENHEEAIRMTYQDYVAVEHPRMGHFACRT